MYSKEVIDQFDGDIAAADEALSYGAENSPHVVTPQREAEMRRALGTLYLPNLEADGTIRFSVARHPDDKLAYLPRSAIEPIETVIVEGILERYEEPASTPPHLTQRLFGILVA